MPRGSTTGDSAFPRASMKGVPPTMKLLAITTAAVVLAAAFALLADACGGGGRLEVTFMNPAGYPCLCTIPGMSGLL
jgi:hypothetical protein